MKLPFSPNERVALALAGALILGPLFMAPAPCLITQPAKYYCEEEEWKRIFVGTHITDWLTLLFLGAQLLVFGRQADISDRQNELIAGQNAIAHQAYIAAHRPKLVIRGVYLDREEATEGSKDRGYCIQYTLTNIGGSKGTIVGGGFVSHKWRRVFQPFTTDVDASALPGQLFLRPGESVKGTIIVDLSNEEISELMHSAEIQKSTSPDFSAHDLVFRGMIIYVDDNGIKRRTAVWRTCAGPPTLRMIPTDDTDYEYAD